MRRTKKRSLMCAMAIVAIFMLLAVVDAAPMRDIRSITVKQQLTKDIITITADGPMTFHQVKSPTQIFIDIPDSRYVDSQKVKLILSKTIKLVRVADIVADRSITRINIVLNDKFPSKISSRDNQIFIEIEKDSLPGEKSEKSSTSSMTASEQVDYYYTQGKTLARLGKWSEAIDEYIKALKIDPTNEKVKLALDVAKGNIKTERESERAKRLYENGQFNEAVSMFSKITQMWPDDIEAHFYLGKAYMKLARYREAVREFEVVLSLNPNYQNAAELYEIAKRRKLLNTFSITCTNQDIVEVLKNVLHGTGLNLLVEDGVKKNISCSFVDKTLEEALDEIIVKNGFRYEKGEKVIRIMPDIPSAEDRVFAQCNLVDLELGNGLETLARMMEKNIIMDKSVDEIKSRKVTFYIKDELTIKEIFDLLLRTNDLLAIPYNANTYIIITRKAAKESNNYVERSYKVFKIANVKPSALKQQIFAIGAIKEAIPEEDVSAVDETHLLTVYATPQHIELIGKIIKELDVKQQQVTIVVKMLEISKNARNKLGTYLYNTIYDPSMPGSMATTTSMNSTTGLKFSYKNLGKISLTKLDALLEMLENDDLAKTISSPITRVVDGETANIKSGTVIPVKDEQLKPQYENGKIVGYTSEITWTEANIGIQLNVTPTVHSDDEITLQIEITKDSADLTSVEVGSHFIKYGKSTKTKLRVKDGETIVLGGLIEAQENANHFKLPFIARIPIIGRFFRSDSQSRFKDELIIFLTCYIVNKPSGAAGAFEKGGSSSTASQESGIEKRNGVSRETSSSRAMDPEDAVANAIFRSM